MSAKQIVWIFAAPCHLTQLFTLQQYGRLFLLGTVSPIAIAGVQNDVLQEMILLFGRLTLCNLCHNMAEHQDHISSLQLQPMLAQFAVLVNYKLLSNDCPWEEFKLICKQHVSPLWFNFIKTWNICGRIAMKYGYPSCPGLHNASHRSGITVSLNPLTVKFLLSLPFQLLISASLVGGSLMRLYRDYYNQ